MGEPDFGTEIHLLVDELHMWILGVYGMLAWLAQKNLLQYSEPGECGFVFVEVGLIPHSEQIMKKGKPMHGLSTDYSYMCEMMGTELAALPLSTVHEFKIFNKWMKETFSKNRELLGKDYKLMANDFLNKSNGKNIPLKQSPC